MDGLDNEVGSKAREDMERHEGVDDGEEHVNTLWRVDKRLNADNSVEAVEQRVEYNKRVALLGG